MRLTIAALFSLLLVGCSSSTPCEGGLLLPDGSCVAKCENSLCPSGSVCVNNACTLTCTSHGQCQKFTQECKPAVDDSKTAILTCQEVPRVTAGDRCETNDDCASGMTCHTKGPGDTLAYCTPSCGADSDCPGGYECGSERVGTPICGTTIGNNSFCGKTTEPCVDRSALEQNHLVEGPFCVERRLCLKRDVCSSCASDVDCSRNSGLNCVDSESGKICAATCAMDTDCDADKQCTDGHCIPRFGACKSAQPDFCSPCRFDLDCGDEMACMQLHGNEHACLDPRFQQSCTRDTDCPVSPGGHNAVCDSQAKVCYLPNNGDFYTCY